MSRETVNILLLLPQGFEDLEAVTILDVFGWTQYREHLPKVLVTKTGFHEVITGRFGTTIRCDIPLEGIKPQLYHALVLPGGFHSYGFDEAYDVRIHKLAREIHQNGGYIASMCVGILPIADAGLLRGKKATTYPYSRNHDNVDRLKSSGARMVKYHMVMDNRIISCDGRGSSLNVAFLLMESLIAPEMTRELRKYMIYDPKS